MHPQGARLRAVEIRLTPAVKKAKREHAFFKGPVSGLLHLARKGALALFAAVKKARGAIMQERTKGESPYGHPPRAPALPPMVSGLLHMLKQEQGRSGVGGAYVPDLDALVGPSL